MIVRLFFVFFVLAALNSAAQKNYEDAVYLKNGSIIRGIIIEQIPNQSLKIKTKDGNIFVYKIEEVEKITHEEKKTSRRGKSSFDDADIKKTGFITLIEISNSVGVDSSQTTGIGKSDIAAGIHAVIGYLLSPYFSAGAGIGFDKYNNTSLTPVCLDLRAYFLKGALTPFIIGDAGYAFGFDDNKGGFFINPAFGIRFFISSKAALNFSFGFRLQENVYHYDYFGHYYNLYGSGYAKEKREYISIKTGVTF